MSETTKQRLLRQASALIGLRELATRLQVPESLLEAWIRGDVTMPNRSFLNLANALDSWATGAKAK